ncbi:MAG: Xaa-Pro peptidase family protein [Sphingomonadaceae bacterium]|nr:Xaa-Pro peptidase family protein [Sphingomonadaceae bacterium]
MIDATRRELIGGVVGTGLAAAVPAGAQAVASPAPITAPERAQRLERARELMDRHRIDAILIEPGSSLVYFTGIEWGRSERPTLALLPRRGDPVVLTPFFERPSVRESLKIPVELIVWQEDEQPLGVLAAAMAKRGLARAAIGIEENVRWFIPAALREALPGVRLVGAAPVVRGCRMRKSSAELGLMKRAADVTVAAYREVVPRLREGMTPAEVSALMAAAHQAASARHLFALVLMGEAAAYPHGSGKPQRLKPGEAVLMDCGCSVEGYQSDISRTIVLGSVPGEVRSVWETVAEGQHVAMAAAKPGAPAGSVDDAVRRFYELRGFGPGYQLPGLSHRTGHGIGLDGHEPVNLVHGETAPLAPGMCFSNEPGIYLPGKFGVRLEDCFWMTGDGPRWFSEPQPSIDRV